MGMGWGGGGGVKACPLGVGGAGSPFGAVEKSTMTPEIRFTCLTNGSPAAIVASARALICWQQQRMEIQIKPLNMHYYHEITN